MSPNLAPALKALIERHGFTQERLAKMIGVARPTISQWMTGAARPRANNLKELAVAFDMKLPDLISELGLVDEEASMGRTTEILLTTAMVVRVKHEQRRDSYLRKAAVLRSAAAEARALGEVSQAKGLDAQAVKNLKYAEACRINATKMKSFSDWLTNAPKLPDE